MKATRGFVFFRHKKDTECQGESHRKCKGSWFGRFDYTSPDGRHLSKIRQGENKSDADEQVQKLIAEHNAGDPRALPAQELTLEQYCNRWLESVARKRVSSRTYHDYETLLERYVYPSLKARQLTKLTGLEIQECYNHMLENGLSPRTVRYTHAVLHSALKQAVRWKVLSSNPAEIVELPKQKRNEMKVLSHKQVTEFLKAAAGDRYALVFAFAVATGMRPEEYLGLQWQDIDLKKGTASVQRVLIYPPKGPGWHFGNCKTARSRRSVPLPASIIAGLARHKREQAEERLAAGEKYQKHDLVFTTIEGGPLHHRNLINRHFKPILKKAKLPMIRLYDLRHTCATLLLAAGVNPKIVGERLGHASIVLTLDTYSHILPSMQQQAAEQLESMLFGETTKKK